MNSHYTDLDARLSYFLEEPLPIDRFQGCSRTHYACPIAVCSGFLIYSWGGVELSVILLLEYFLPMDIETSLSYYLY